MHFVKNISTGHKAEHQSTQYRKAKKTFSLAIKLALFSSLASGVAQAQIGVAKPTIQQDKAGPTLEATQAWLVEKVNNLRFDKIMIDGSLYGGQEFKLSFSGCSMRYVIAAESVANNGTGVKPYVAGKTHTAYEVENLADLSIDNSVARQSASIFSDQSSTLTISTLGRREVISEYYALTNQPLKFEKKTFVYGMLFPDHELAVRAQNALHHAIRLCVKQRAEQKAAEPAKPKEIF